jgi:Tfp pilus assembly protein PilF
MSKMLSLVDRLLLLGRNLHACHQDGAALRYLARLAALPDLPPDLAEEVQGRLAELCLQRRRYRRARRHLAVALLYRPDGARYHYLMARACTRGAHADPARAIGHYREALRLDPKQAVWRAELGTLLLREGQRAEGLGELTQAASQAPDEPEVIDRLVRGLCRAGRAGEALRVLRAAQFRRPRDARFRQLYQAFRFRRLQARQRAERRAAIIWNNEDGLTLLPFLRIDAPVDRPGERQDEPHALPGPHHRRPARRPDWKHG